jgi:predicted PolB exonuclease-like 3'-5' exonuclease
MFKESFSKLIIFDIETAREYETLDQMPLAKADLWSKRATWLRNRYPENVNSTDAELYIDKASLHPEFSKIICISIAQIKDGGRSLTVKSYSGEEHDLLQEFLKLNANVYNKIPGATYCGHNIKRFDVPFIAKRLAINGLAIPINFQIFKMKTWEIPFLDTSDVWSFGAWQESYCSLELLCNSLGVPTPKDGVVGKEVGEVYYNGGIDRIVEYCEKDVEATCKVLLKLSNLDINVNIDKK